MKTIIDLTGQKFGRLTILSIAKKHKGQYFWNCVCDCGNTCIVRSKNFKSGSTKSCGCLLKEKAKTLGIAYGKNNRIKASIKKILPDSAASKNNKYASYRCAAKRRNLEFSLSKEEFLKLVQGSCYYCNSLPSNIHKVSQNSGTFIYNGIDRIDNTKGYNVENCVPCCKRCNTGKMNISKEEFIAWIKKVYAYLQAKGEIV